MEDISILISGLIQRDLIRGLVQIRRGRKVDFLLSSLAKTSS